MSPSRPSGASPQKLGNSRTDRIPGSAPGAFPTKRPFSRCGRIRQHKAAQLPDPVEVDIHRQAGLAALPWRQPAAVADEFDRAVSDLSLRGVPILGRPGAGFLDDPAYRPVLDRIAARGVPLYVHPFHPIPQVQQVYYTGFNEKVASELSLAAWGWHHEAGIHVLRLILAGVFERLPGLQVISGHWGEMVLFYLSRLDTSFRRATPGCRGRSPRSTARTSGSPRAGCSTSPSSTSSVP